MGVLDRIVEIADYDEPQPPSHRAPYRYHMPLQFIPGVGSVTLNRLLNYFGTEMAVLHLASEEEMAQLVGTRVAHRIALAREGELPIIAGGGGRYGRAVSDAKYALQMGLPGI
jgi:PHP family Zn ribbon phosphoesterase